MGRTDAIGPAMPQSLVYRTLYALMAMTLAYLVVTLTVSKCCYRCCNAAAVAYAPKPKVLLERKCM